jgi:hypothetical protein
MANLVTRAEFKAYAGISSSSQDALIDNLLPKVSALVRKICKTEFLDDVGLFTDIYDGGSSLIYPRNSPVVSISSLSLSEDYGVTYTALVNYTDWVYKANDQAIQSIDSTFPVFINGYKLIYSAGYTSIADDLKLAVLDLVQYYLRNDAAVHANRAPSSGSIQIEYLINTNLPAHIKRILDQYTMNYN